MMPNPQQILFRLFLLSSIFALNPLSIGWAQSDKWNTDFIPDDTFFVLALNVEKLIEPMKEGELFDKLKKEIHDETRLNLSEISQFQFVMGGDEEDMSAEDFDDEDILEVKVFFNKDQNIEEIVEKMFRRADVETVKHEGVEYFRSERRTRPSVHAPDKRTIVIANEPRLKKLIESPKTMGNFVDQLARADADADIFLAFENNKVLDQIFLKEIERELDGLPFNLRDIASEAKSGQLTVNLSSKKPITGQIIHGDAEGADRVKRALDALIALGKVGIPEVKKELDRERMPEEMRKLAKEGIAIADSLLNGAEFATAQHKLNIEFKSEADLKNAVKIFSTILFGRNMASSELKGEIVEGEASKPIEQK